MPEALIDLPQRRKFLIYFAAMVGMFMATLDMQIVATALPTIVDDLGSLDLFSWIGAAYLLTSASVTPFYGKLGDQFGRKRVFLVAIAIFTIGSLACGMAWSMESLIAARVLQALGGGGLMTTVFGIIADLFEPRQRARYQGFSSAVFTLAGVIAPVAGGIISQTIGWEFVFLINVPIGIALIAVILVVMPNIATGRAAKVDFPGGLLLAASVTMLVFWAEEALGGGYGGVMVYLLPVLVVLAVAALLVVERRAAEPILPLRLFSDPTIAIVLSVSVLTGMVTLGMLNYFALFLQTVTGLPPALAGLLFLPASLGALIASVGSGLMISRTGRYKPYPVAGMAVGFASMFAFTLVDAQTPLWAIAILMFLQSCGMGLQMQTLMVALQAAAPRRDVGAATGALTLARMMGASLGLGVSGGMLTAALTREQTALPPDIIAQLPVPLAEMTPAAIAGLPADAGARAVGAFANAFDSVFHLGMLWFAVGFVALLFLKDVRLPGRGETPAAQPAPAPGE